MISIIFYFNLNVQPHNIQKSLDIIKKELLKISKGSIKDDDIERAKKIIQAQEVFGNQFIQFKSVRQAEIDISFKVSMSTEDRMKGIMNVSKEDIIFTSKWLYENLNILAVCSDVEGVEYEF